MQLPTAQQTLQIPDLRSGDLYTYNSLHSFSFGSAQPQPQQSPSRSIHPLSSVHGDGDSIGEDLRLGPFDLTPRPSVVAYEQSNQRGHITQQASNNAQLLNRNITQRGDEHAPRAVEFGANFRAGPSIASTSSTSLSSSTAGDFLRSDSPASQNSSYTSQTSAEQSVIADDDNRHPHTINPTSPGPDSSGTSNTAVEFSSDEEFGDSEYDYDYYDEEGVSIEIGSTQYEGSVTTHDGDRNFHVGISNSSGSNWNGFNYMERRGSIAIPETPPVEESSIFVTGRNREGSLATLRRPSRSLDGDFVNLGVTRPTPSNQSTIGHQLQSSPTSVPGTGGDWRLLEERGKDREISRNLEASASLSSSKSPVCHVSKLTSDPAISASDFDLDWAQMQRGITGLDSSAMGDIVGSSSLPPGSGNRRPSATGDVGANWLLSWTREARRPSAATVSSYGGDTFGKAIRDWDGPSYQAQRRDWSFRKEKGDAVKLPGEKSAAGNILSPKGSMAAEKSMPGHAERDTDREKRITSAAWKGMRLNTHEYWSNDRLGRFRVERRARRGTLCDKFSIKYLLALFSYE